ncbi:MAG: F0F1 ATP synthase subunit A [Candidatus Dormibacteraceae bacterium]
MTYYLAESIGELPTVNLGCGAFCTFNYTTLIVSAISIALTLLILGLIARRLSSGTPGKLQMVIELLYNYVSSLVRESVAEDAGFIIPLAMTIFLFILIANWIDFFPLDAVGGLHPANSDINQAAAMAVVVILMVQGYSIKVLGFKGYLRRFTRPFDMHWAVRAVYTPLNILEEVVKPVTLSLRLFGNIFAGVVMVLLITILLGSVPVVGTFALAPAVLVAWKFFDVFFVGTIQAFIFMLLTVMYFGMAREGLIDHH